MAKTLIEFQNKLIDLYLLRTIEKDEHWCPKEEDTIFTIEINKSVPESVVSTKFTFKFNNEEHRDKEWEILTMKLEDVEFLEIL